MSCLAEALGYAERGWHVFPLHAPEGAGCSCGKSDCPSTAKHPRTKDGLTSATTDPATIREWWKRWPTANVGICTGVCSGLVVLDVDGDDGKASLQALQAIHGTIPATLRAWTGRTNADAKRNGCHYFFKMPEGVELRNGTGTLGAGLDTRGEGGYVVAAPSKHRSGLSYQWLKKDMPLAEVPAWMLASLTKPKLALESKRVGAENAEPDEGIFLEGGRNTGLTRLAGVLRNKGLDADEIAAALLVANQKRCKPSVPDSEVQTIARSVARYPPQPSQNNGLERVAKPVRNWPSPLSEAAYHGIAGEFVRLVGPETEADPAALLFQLLTALGSIIGRGPYYPLGQGRHRVNLFMVCVADSSKGRKGTSWDEVRAFTKLVDIGWYQARIGGGLSTGEGLIHAVRPIVEKVPIKEKGRVIDTQEQTTDAGVTDKRLLCVEGELGQTLQCVGREGNTLSPIVRLAWDGSLLRVMTRSAKAECAEPHISIIGHVTNTELQTLLTTNDAANGFANRFMWIGVTRSKLLPFAGTVNPERLAELAERTRKAVEMARDIGKVDWAPEARPIWERVYPALSAGGQGLLGSVTARAEAHTVRLASLYALLDGSNAIGVAHINAALELWRYSADSAAFIFGGSLGDPTCDSIVELLRGKPDGATRMDITEHFNRNKTKAQLDAGLGILQSKAMIRSEMRETGGRTAEVWYLVSI